MCSPALTVGEAKSYRLEVRTRSSLDYAVQAVGNIHFDARVRINKTITLATLASTVPAIWKDGWLAGCHTPVLCQNGETCLKTFLTSW